MSFITVTSPHQHGQQRTAWVMRQVCYATLPALAALTFSFGIGSIINVLWCVAIALILEGICLKLRKKNLEFYLSDGSAVVTGLLLGLSISPLSPWWLSVIGLIFAIPIAKHLYGGLGQNPFNPAMIAYALLLVSFPVEMTRWPTGMNSIDSTLHIFLDQYGAVDLTTGATPLDNFKTNHHSPTLTWLANGNIDLPESMMVNVMFALGGLYLLAKKIITWHIPVSILACLTVLSTLFFMIDNQHYASPMLHLLTGATMIGAFFIATDPVTAATSNGARLIYGVGIGVLIYIIRTWGGYPDAVAFAVLLMNLAAPMIDHLYQPRTFGHQVSIVKWRNKS